MLMTKSTTIIKMATQNATLRRGPMRAKRQSKEKLLAPGKLELQYLQVCAWSGQMPPHSGQDFEYSLSDIG
jgi:hypothetical protein